ncbi:MAG: aspartate aminotransferase family protein [bacterium]|nr:aspartate aminotransferase family protein [bacterium]
MNRQDIIRKKNDYIFPAIFQYYENPLIFSKGKGHYLYDIDNREYLDFFGGVLTVSVGHCNEEISERIAGQLMELQHVSTLYLTEEMVNFSEKLAEIAPAGLRKSFITNSGTEANETAMLAAKLHTGNQELITLRYSYHGRSAMAMTMSGHHSWKIGGTHVLGIKHAHNAYCYRCAFNQKYPDCDLQCAKDLEELILTDTSGSVAGFIGEPIQGVGGFITPPKEYFTVIYDIVKKYGGIFISDEVQTGFGRTGENWWGIEHYGVKPDMITCAKGIANGSPCGATITTDDIAGSFKGTTFSTFGGNPVTSTAGLATIEYIEKNNLKENAKITGDYLRDKLNELQDKYPVIGDVRGMGLMQALELVLDDKEPAVDLTVKILEKTKDKGLLIGKAGLYNNVIRLAPHLTVGKDEIDTAAKILDEIFAEL